jgi:hypothetical protein
MRRNSMRRNNSLLSSINLRISAICVTISCVRSPRLQRRLSLPTGAPLPALCMRHTDQPVTRSGEPQGIPLRLRWAIQREDEAYSSRIRLTNSTITYSRAPLERVWVLIAVCHHRHFNPGCSVAPNTFECLGILLPSLTLIGRNKWRHIPWARRTQMPKKLLRLWPSTARVALVRSFSARRSGARCSRKLWMKSA